MSDFMDFLKHKYAYVAIGLTQRNPVKTVNHCF